MDAMEFPKEDSYLVQPGVFRLMIPGRAEYRVEEGRGIFIAPFSNVPADELCLYLLGSAMAALLYQRGLFPLHGSAGKTPWWAMIFVGTQGAGKSTLAAQFDRKGYRLLSDDVCAVEAMPEGLRILPTLTQFGLCSDAYERLGNPESAHFDVQKFEVSMGEGYCPHPMPLKAIHVLANHDDSTPDFDVLRGLNGAQNPLENLYHPHFLMGQGTQSDLKRMAGLIAQKTTMAVVSRRLDPAAIDGLVTFLESAWAERFNANPLKEKN
jgi:hypothetical protein